MDLSPKKEVVLGSGGLMDITHEDGAIGDVHQVWEHFV